MKPDWESIQFVVFDVDGTLYDQRALRIRMARDMLFHAIRKANLTHLSVIKAYRNIRERLAEAQATDFDLQLMADTVASTGASEEQIRAIVQEWLENRPLAYLMSCRFPHLSELFSGLKQNGKVVGILSDYPAHAKLAALGLVADHVVSATDQRVQRLKPHPKGLQVLIADAGFTAAQTLMIGDRVERDGDAARRAGVASLIRSSTPKSNWQTFVRFDDPLFAPILPVLA
ncbi:HAD superfamily hydrolase (TIGR01549 family) [Oxalobacteraceae bacterium GrIS 1.11]